MNVIRRFVTVAAATASLALVGCSPAVVAGPGAGIGLNLGSLRPTLLSPTNCAVIGGAFGMGQLTPAAMVGQRMQQIRQLQSRFSLASSDVRAKQARWMAAAERGC